MKARRAPDRVHVVRPPQDENNVEIVRVLAQITDKLKRSEAERQELLAELREYRRSLTDLEDKAGQTEKAYLNLENKIKAKDDGTDEVSERQARFEKALKDAEDKLVKSIAGQAVLDQRLKDTEDSHTAIHQRLDESIAAQTRMDRQIEKVSQDKARMLRKVERLEDAVVETKDALQAKAMVLLTDQGIAAQKTIPQLEHDAQGANDDIAPSAWDRTTWTQGVGTVAMVIAALLAGWVINQVQQPEIPQVAVLENGGLAQLNLDENRWEPVVLNNETVPSAKLSELNALEQQKLSARLPVAEEKPLENISIQTPPPVPIEEETPIEITEEVAPAVVPKAEPSAPTPLDYNNDEQLLAALEQAPEDVASQLNEISPSISRALELDEPEIAAAAPTPVPETAPQQLVQEKPAPKVAQPKFEEAAFRQDPEVDKAIRDQKSTGNLKGRITPDNSLPQMVKAIEMQAFDGVAEAQHDLAAIYTAGHGGVAQNFEKASFWFREAADNGIANARYNLGVLYHQGLGVERDLTKALYWYREAAKLDHPEALYNLGIAHIEGIGTDYNASLASDFFEKAANQGIMEAAYNLGLIYENGLIDEAKPDEALMWYKIAADQGSPDAKAAMEQLAGSLQIGMEDVGKLVERMQAINEATKGRRAGPAPGAKKKGTEPSKAALDRRAITAQIQKHLNDLGLYPGPADGIPGPKTAAAISKYQASNSLAVNGQPSEGLLSHIMDKATPSAGNKN